jgi:hypothetical protein
MTVSCKNHASHAIGFRGLQEASTLELAVPQCVAQFGRSMLVARLIRIDYNDE